MGKTQICRRAQVGEDFVGSGYRKSQKEGQQETRKISVEDALTFLRPIKKAWLCNMNEEAGEELPMVGNSVAVKLDPFKIVTVMAEF